MSSLSGSMPEELLRSSSNRVLYNEICNALEREGRIYQRSQLHFTTLTEKQSVLQH